MPLVNKEMTRKLQEIFHRPGITVVPGGVTPWHAMMAEAAGFEAFYISGGMSHRWYLGTQDAGWITGTEFAENGARVVKAVNIPVFSDADTAGTATTAYRFVKEYIWAGLAGCHIEDVVYPKGVVTRGQNAGRILHENARLVSREEAAGKIRAAVDAKRELDPNFVVIARTDARQAIGGGLEESIARGLAYAQAGADVLMFDGMASWDECRYVLSKSPLPSFFVADGAYPDANGKRSPPVSLAEREKAGEKIYLAVGGGMPAGDQAAWEMLLAVKAQGPLAQDEFRKSLASKPKELRMPDLFPRERLWELEEKYLPGPQ